MNGKKSVSFLYPSNNQLENVMNKKYPIIMGP